MAKHSIPNVKVLQFRVQELERAVRQIRVCCSDPKMKRAKDLKGRVVLWCDAVMPPSFEELGGASQPPGGAP